MENDEHSDIFEEDEDERMFERAAEYMRNNRSLKLSTEQKLKLYGLFKQASGGPCNISRPGLFDVQGRHKWDAWHKLGSLAKHDAVVAYINLVTDLDPKWQEKTDLSHEGERSEETRGRGGGGGGGPVVSTLMKEEEEEILDEHKSVFDWCKEGNVDRLAAMVTQAEVDCVDEEGLSMLHWACDRGHLEVVKFLLQSGADVNLQDKESQTALHYAASCGHGDVVQLLLTATNIDTAIEDCDGATPIQVSSDPHITKLLQIKRTHVHGNA